MAGRYQGRHAFVKENGEHLHVEVFWQQNGWFWRSYKGHVSKHMNTREVSPRSRYNIYRSILFLANREIGSASLTFGFSATVGWPQQGCVDFADGGWGTERYRSLIRCDWHAISRKTRCLIRLLLGHDHPCNSSIGLVYTRIHLHIETS